MWKQSVWTSTISGHLAALHLRQGGLLTLAGAKAALSGTGGKPYICADRRQHDDLARSTLTCPVMVAGFLRHWRIYPPDVFVVQTCRFN